MILAGFISDPAAQSSKNPSPFHEIAKPRRIEVDSDGKAKDLVSLVLKQYGLSLEEDQWQIFITHDGSATPNAASNYVGGKRQIYFNAAFMGRVSKEKRDWTLVAIAAHEVGHHLGNHVLRPWLRRQLAEREADYTAGFVLGRMGAAYEQTIDAVRWLPGGTASDYPSRGQRLCEIGRGWRDANRIEPLPELRPANAASALQLCEGQHPDPKKFRIRVNRDIYGNDIIVGGQPGLPGIDLAACASRCEGMAECKAFSFDSWHGWCFLKSKISESVLDPPSIIGVKRPDEIPRANQQAQPVVQIVHNRRFRDDPREKPKEAVNLDACKERCRVSLDCVAFSFIKVSGLCFLFDKTEGHYVDDLADSGYKRQLPVITNKPN